MKKKGYTIINALDCLVMAAVLLACTKTEMPLVQQAVPLGIEAGIEWIGSGTRAPVTGSALPVAQSIIMSAYYNPVAGSGQNYFSGQTFTYSGGTTWQFAGGYWPLAGTLDMLGYSLADAGHVSSVSWGDNAAASVTMTLADNSANQDDLVAGGAGAMTSSSKTMTFSHAEALISFTASSNVAYDAEANLGVTITDIKINAANHSGTVTCTRSGSSVSFTWGSLGSAATISLPSLSATNLGTAAASLSGTPGLILPPQAAKSMTIYYTVHLGKDESGGNLDQSMSHTFTPAGSWAAGTKYVYQIYITETNISVNLSDILAWTADTVHGENLTWEE